MKLCNNSHDVVCFECEYCPVCNEREEVRSLVDEIDELEAKIEELKISVEEMKNE